MINIPTPDFADVLASATLGFGIVYIVSHLRASLSILKDSTKYRDNPYSKNPDVNDLFKRSKKN